MSIIKIYGTTRDLDAVKQELSNTIHSCFIDTFQWMQDSSRTHRFIGLADTDFAISSIRNLAYLILEITLYETSDEVKDNLTELLLDRIEKQNGIKAEDIEISFVERPAVEWDEVPEHDACEIDITFVESYE